MGLLIQASLAEFLATAADKPANAGESAEEGFGDLLAALFASLAGSHDAVAGDQEREGDVPLDPAAVAGPAGEEGDPQVLPFPLASALLSVTGQQGEMPFSPADVLEFLLDVTGEDADIQAVDEVAAFLGFEAEGATIAGVDTAIEDGDNESVDGEELPAQQRQRGSPAVPIDSSEEEHSVVRFVGNAEETATDDSPDTAPSQGESRAGNVAFGTTVSASSSVLSASATTSAPSSPPPQFVPPQPSPATQVGQAIIDRIAQGGGEARIRLDPPELGEVLIRVRIEGDRVRVEVHVERSEAAQVLRSSSNDLSSLLGQRGLNLDDVSVEHGGREPGQQQSEGSGDAGAESEGQTFAAILGIDDDDTGGDLRTYNLLKSAYNPDGAYLFRV